MNLDDKLYPAPTSLSECFTALDGIFAMSEEEKDWFKAADEDEAVGGFHTGLGMEIRNKWGFWTRDTEIYRVMKGMGLWHADDMYSIVFTSYHRKINGKELGLKEQVQRHLDYWSEYEKINGPIEKD